MQLLTICLITVMLWFFLPFAYHSLPNTEHDRLTFCTVCGLFGNGFHPLSFQRLWKRLLYLKVFSMWKNKNLIPKETKLSTKCFSCTYHSFSLLSQTYNAANWITFVHVDHPQICINLFFSITSYTLCSHTLL